ncbi:MAG: phosphotransferase [Tetrasphaera jenkinsii]|nr:phosphotransferase [Tetrasphaera jenkinsii]
MTRTPLQLAALASAAVPGLDPVAVAALPTASAAPYDAAVVTDAGGQKWLVQAPTSPAGAAELDAAAAVAELLGRRLTTKLPTPTGFAVLPEGGRAVVHRFIPGSGINLEALGPDSALVAEIGTELARIHNLEPELLENAGLETYAADTYRRRHLSDLDRAAASGRVPPTLLGRWEQALENVAIWQFAPTPIHGGIDGRHLLVEVRDAEPKITGITGWRRAKVADPADDFAAIVRDCEPDTTTEIARAYAQARSTRPDRHLLTRAQVIGEFGYVTNLFDALAQGYPDRVREATGWLEQLADDVGDTELIR